ncbi:alanyl-tRNA editing protein Aarsd1-A [Eurytemora carolleeae]|uniref:alanyl-tRNA editing protein Aarsd1-A n=1 Tax=Eurytemora carolleeae TaxID=1294199 RepID=UPI000C776C2E|nr:alanyl-tRNA editing protein Aarsd1-A [Eurytemora carolleeae]|eukprot:XP_023331171.1 alanyl-tRNA editing protein Aarsd1-A-like [Eurytemora affinis]
MFYCQRESYSRELETEVISCSATSRQLDTAGRKAKVDGFEVTFKETVFFPEGGGQNADKGLVGGVEVLDVYRRGTVAVHFLAGELQPGSVVRQSLDWNRRFDNMQQHSGQHLVSAVLEREYNINTTAWWMAESSENKVGLSYIELDKPVPPETLSLVEERCNSAIQDAIPVSVKLFQIGDPELDAAHTRGLPADHAGPVRLIQMGEIDSNLCCGTHVSNLSHLQAIKLLFTEKMALKSI